MGTVGSISVAFPVCRCLCFCEHGRAVLHALHGRAMQRDQRGFLVFCEHGRAVPHALNGRAMQRDQRGFLFHGSAVQHKAARLCRATDLPKRTSISFPFRVCLLRKTKGRRSFTELKTTLQNKTTFTSRREVAFQAEADPVVDLQGLGPVVRIVRHLAFGDAFD